MKKILPLIFAAALGAWLAGCAGAKLDLTPEGDPNRVLNGNVLFRVEQPLPPDAEATVRVLDPASVEQSRAEASRDLPIATRPQVQLPPTVLAEQTIKLGAATNGVPFHLEFRASDDLLRHGLNLEARISYGGRVYFRTLSAHLVTLSTIGVSHDVWVQAAGR